MLNFATLTALAIALVAIAPGYIASSLWLRSKTWERPPTDFGLVLQSLVVSVVVQIVASPLTILWLLPVKDQLTQQPWRVAIWAALVVLIIPIALGIGFGRLADVALEATLTAPNGWAQGMIRTLLPRQAPSSWDDFFDSEIADGKFLVITLNDGSKLAGYFAEPSYAMTSPTVQGIYVAEEWLLDKDDNFERAVRGTNGFLIPNATAIRSIQVRESQEDSLADKEGKRDAGKKERQNQKVYQEVAASKEVTSRARLLRPNIDGEPPVTRSR